MSAIGIDDIEGLLGVSQYEEVGEFPVEQGYIWTTCSSVENGNPLFWDPEVAEEVTGGRSPHRPWCRCGSPAPLGAEPLDTGPAPPDPLRPEGGPRPARGRHERQHHRLPRAGTPR